MNEFWEVLNDDRLRGLLVRGAVWSLALMVTSGLLSAVLALLLAPAREHRLWGWAVDGFVELFRNVPTLLWLLFFYIALPECGGIAAWLGSRPGFACAVAIAGLSLSNAAYLIDILSGGLRGVSTGCQDAARASGCSRWQAYWLVSLPVAVIAVSPALLARMVHNAKNTSLVLVIGVADITWASQQIESLTFRFFGATALATLFYLVVCGGLYTVGDVLARRLARFREASHGHA